MDGATGQDEPTSAEDEPLELDESETEEPSDAEEGRAGDNDLHVLRMLYRGNMEEVRRREEQCRHARVFNRKHTFYRQTRCTDTAQEEQSARMPPSTVLGGLCQASRLFRGCKVALSRNVSHFYGVANGTRGRMVGVVDGPGGVGTLPEAVVCEFPNYCGRALYDSKSHWVPIRPILAMRHDSRLTRYQFPLTAGIAVTVSSAQGLTNKDSVVIHLVGQEHAVVWTIKGGQSDMLRMRQKRIGRLHGHASLWIEDTFFFPGAGTGSSA